MGNRGILHDEKQVVIRPYQVKRWIICQLQFKNRQRQVMSPNQYTELFFLDEATALSAGHRPCFECQRERALAFQAAWQRAQRLSKLPTAKQMDTQLHDERLTDARLLKDKRKRTHTAVLGYLPSGTFVEIEKRPCLWWQSTIYPWTIGGYLSPISLLSDKLVVVLTPNSIIQTIQFGYIPMIHHSISAH